MTQLRLGSMGPDEREGFFSNSPFLVELPSQTDPPCSFSYGLQKPEGSYLRGDLIKSWLSCPAYSFTFT